MENQFNNDIFKELFKEFPDSNSSRRVIEKKKVTIPRRSPIQSITKLHEFEINNIQGTMSLKNYSNIENLLNVQNSLIKFNFDEKEGNIFYKKVNDSELKIAYYEIFNNHNLIFTYSLNPNISYLFTPDKKNEKEPDLNSCFGVRYYRKSPKLKSPYFTLLKDKEGYFILEKNKEILDNEGKTFYNEELNCFRIMEDNIFSRYKLKDNSSNDYPTLVGEHLIELLGFSYSLTLENIESIEFLPIFFQEKNEMIDLNNLIKEDKMHNKLYILPILYNGVISVLYSFDSKEGKKNFLCDPSHYHFKEGSLFANLEKGGNQIQLIPELDLQKFNSSGMWFIIQMCVILNKKIEWENDYKYNNANDIFIGITNKSFFRDILNCYGDHVYLPKKIIEFVPDVKNIIYNDDYIYFISKNSYVKIYKKVFLNHFIDIHNLLSYIYNFRLISSPFYIIEEFQQTLEELHEKLLLVKLNLNLLEINGNQNKSLLKDFVIIIKNLQVLNQLILDNAITILRCKSNLIYNNNTNEKIKDEIEIKEYGMSKLMVSTYFFEFIVKNLKEYFQKLEQYFFFHSNKVSSKILFPILGLLFKEPLNK